MFGSKIPIRNVHAGKKPWLLDCRSVGGVREFYATEDEAKAAREAKIVEVRNHGTAALSLKPEERAEFARARDRLAVLGASVADAVRFYEQHHAQLTPLKISAALDLLVREKETAGNRVRSIKNLRSNVTALKNAIGDKLVSEVSRNDIVQWLATDGWKPATIRTKRIDLQTFFRAAKARQWSTQDPTAVLEKEKQDDKAPGILTVAQAKRLMHAARDHEPRFCGYLALALFAGIRPEEIQAMQETDIDLKRGVAIVAGHIAKTRKRRVVELSPNCQAWLRIGAEFPPQNTRGLLNKLRIAAGFEGFKKKLTASREQWIKVAGEKWPHDCLRHSFASYHLALHGSAEKTALQMGHHSTDMLFRHYRELVTPQEAKRFWAIKP